MNDIRKELIDVLADVRAHLEHQRALGVRAVPIGTVPGADAPSEAPPAPVQGTAAGNLARADTAPGPPAAVQERAAGPSAAGLEGIQQEMGDCQRCKLFKGRSTIVFGEGSSEAAVVFVGEGPGFEEDQQGRPFVGPAGQLLTDIIEKGMRIKRTDVYICNIVKCRPPGNRNPEPDEVETCIGFVKKQIAAIKPKVIVTLGNVPTQNLLGTKAGITKLRGTWQEYDGIPVMPTFHPSYLLRSPGEKKWVWADIQQVMKKLGMTLPEKG